MGKKDGSDADPSLATEAVTGDGPGATWSPVDQAVPGNGFDDNVGPMNTAVAELDWESLPLNPGRRNLGAP